MKITEFADILDFNLVVRRRNNWKRESTYYASFERVDVKGNGVLEGAFGNGATPQEAIYAYCRQIAGKTLVKNAHTDSRQEFTVPQDLEASL